MCVEDENRLAAGHSFLGDDDDEPGDDDEPSDGLDVNGHYLLPATGSGVAL